MMPISFMIRSGAEPYLDAFVRMIAVMITNYMFKYLFYLINNM